VPPREPADRVEVEVPVELDELGIADVATVGQAVRVHLGLLRERRPPSVDA